MTSLILLLLTGCTDKSDVCMDGFVMDDDGYCQLLPTEASPTDTTPDETDTDPTQTGADDTSAPTDTTDTADTTDTIDEDRTPLAAPRLLRRVSLDLRGVLPDIADLDAVEADPAALADIRARYLEDARLEARMADLLNERWQTRIDKFEFYVSEYNPTHGDLFSFDDPELEYTIERAIADEPLRLMAWIIANNRPWTEILTADYTMADEHLGVMWDLDYPYGDQGWQIAHYTDERPAAGVMASTGLWMRYVTSDANYSRVRAAMLSDLLICEDYLNRPVTFSESEALTENFETEDALRQDPYCMGCHSSLDPLAATLFGFWPAIQYNIQEIDTYHPEREPLGEQLLDVEMEWFGQPVSGLGSLGPVIADDPRFAACAVDTMAELLWRRAPTLDEYELLNGLRQDFVGDWQIKPLMAALMETAPYQVGAVSEALGEDVELTARLLSPDLLDAALYDLTGFRWTWEGYEQLKNDAYGYRILSGGVNGVNVTAPQTAPGVTWAMVIQRAAQAAAQSAVNQGLVYEDGSGLFAGVTLDSTPADPGFREVLADLHWQLYAERAEDTRLNDAEALREAVEALDGPQAAWNSLLSAMLRDPDFVTY